MLGLKACATTPSLKTVLSYHVWVTGIDPGSSARALGALYHWAISPAIRTASLVSLSLQLKPPFPETEGLTDESGAYRIEGRIRGRRSLAGYGRPKDEKFIPDVPNAQGKEEGPQLNRKRTCQAVFCPRVRLQLPPESNGFRLISAFQIPQYLVGLRPQKPWRFAFWEM